MTSTLDPVSVTTETVSIRLRPTYGVDLVTASELLRFARVAVANAGPEALVRIGASGLSAFRSVQLPAFDDGRSSL